MEAKIRPWEDYNELYNEFVVERKSTSELAQQWGTYPMTIRRALIKQGISVRGKSQAQKINIEKNGAPMTGKVRTNDEKIKISEGLQKWWDNMSTEEQSAERGRLSELAKAQWESLSKDERAESIKRMHTHVKVAGSKNENMVADFLINAGFNLIQRTRDFTPARKFEIDMAFPKEKIAIEWDGAAHFMPIFGDVQLSKIQRKDRIKEQTLLAAGWTVIRCRDYSSANTLSVCRRAADKLIDLINNCERGIVHIIEAR